MTAGAKPSPPAKDSEWLAEQRRSTECSYKIFVQVRADRVWVGSFYGPDHETNTPGPYETFARPEGKTHADCVRKAIERATSWVPEDFSAAKNVVADW